MTVRDLFLMTHTISPCIQLFDNDSLCLLYYNAPGVPLGRCNYYDCDVVWINKISPEEISVRIKS